MKESLLPLRTETSFDRRRLDCCYMIICFRLDCRRGKCVFEDIRRGRSDKPTGRLLQFFSKSFDSLELELFQNEP